LEIIRKYLENNEFKLKCILSKQFFTRRRQLPFTTLIALIMNLIRKSLQVEIGSFTRFLNIRSFSKQAFSKARKKLSSVVFELLNEKLLVEFYTDNDFKIYKGLRVLAIDGSTLRLPNEEELYESFGFYEGNGIKSIPLASISTLYDVLNDLTLHAVLTPYCASERDMAKKNINMLCELGTPIHCDVKEISDLLLFDRGYPSGLFMNFLLSKKKHFLMRAQNSFRVTKEAIQTGKRDLIVDLSVLNKSQQTRAKFSKEEKNETITVRILIYTLSSNEKEIIITSLLDQNKFTYNDIFKLYRLRWTIEENYKLYKCIADIENFSGRSKLAIEQDFHATVFTCNIASVLAQEAQEEIEQRPSNKDRKYEYKINRSVLIGTIKDEIVEVLLGDQNLDEYCTKLKEHIKRSLTPIRPGRNNPRIKRSVNRKITINKRCL